MGHTMTTAAGAEFFEQRFRMGSVVTFFASLDSFVLVGMALDTGESCMFCIALVQHFFGLAMTERTHFIWCIIGISNLERFVRGMAGEALVQWSCAAVYSPRCGYRSGVFFVTFEAVRDMSMFCMVTGCTVEVGMSGCKCFDVLVMIWVTDIASLRKSTAGRDREWSMCFLMTAAALHKLFTMRVFMTSSAFG